MSLTVTDPRYRHADSNAFTHIQNGFQLSLRRSYRDLPRDSTKERNRVRASQHVPVLECSRRDVVPNTGEVILYSDLRWVSDGRGERDGPRVPTLQQTQKAGVSDGLAVYMFTKNRL